MVGLEGAGEVLGEEELEVAVDRDDLGFSMKVELRGIGVGSQTDLLGSVLDSLELFKIGLRDVWEPDRSCIYEDGFDMSFVLVP